MRLYGLIGFPLSHSFSKKYFTEKFEKEGIEAQYELFELPIITNLPALFEKYPTLKGLNVTIPHKKAVVPYLTRLAPSAEKVGAVNVIKIEQDGSLTGHNTDYIGFRTTLEKFIAQNKAPMQALLLGNGGAAKAVEAVLKDLNMLYTIVARAGGQASFEELTSQMIAQHTLIVNTTPLGMMPHIDTLPALPYQALSPAHFVYDLVYNPAETLFLQKANAKGAHTHNGLAMLYAQAEEAWRIFGN